MIAIHKREGSFSDRWIKYCQEKDIPHKIVDCYDSDIMVQLEQCEGLIWHWDLTDHKAALFARQLTLSIEQKGIRIFPDTNTSWHYDDKVGQKYLLEAIEAPLVKSYVFYSKEGALKWLEDTTFPIVFKLRGGAGSSNVKLVKSENKGRKLVKKAFASGFSRVSSIERLKERFWMFRRDKNFQAVKKVFTGIARLFVSNELEKFSQREKGYVYFQEFLPKNEYDIRIVVIGNRCFGVVRYCRKGDFRASGSGVLSYDMELIDQKMIKISFDIAKKLKTQSIAFDFIWDGDIPKIVEISYCYTMGKFYDNCPGYWDSELKWHSEEVNPQYFIIEDFIKSIRYIR